MNHLTHKELPVYSFISHEEFYAWLGDHFEDTTGFWLRYYKKHTKLPTIQHTDAVGVALY